LAIVLRRRSATAVSETPTSDGPRASRGLGVAAIVIAVFVIAAAVSAVGFDRASKGQFFPRTTIGGVVVGSTTAAQAESMLRARLLTPLHQPIDLHAPAFDVKADAWKMGMRIDVAKEVHDVLREQRSAPLLTRLWHRMWGEDRNHAIEPNLDRAKLHAFVSDIAKQVDRPMRNASVEVEGDELRVLGHQVGRDMSVRATERHIIRALSLGKTSIGLPVVVTKPQILTSAFAKTILVRTMSNTLTLYRNGKIAKTYGVSTGTGGYPTPLGTFDIVAKRRNPTWVNPHADWSLTMPEYIGPGPNNPLGTRAMNLSASGIRIHGTPHDDSIGTNASHGCIRMHIHDAEDLFDRVDVGTPVVIIGA